MHELICSYIEICFKENLNRVYCIFTQHVASYLFSARKTESIGQSIFFNTYNDCKE